MTRTIDWMFYLLATVLLAILAMTSGCFGNAAMVEAMKDNNATFCARVTTPWGGANYFQSNPIFGTATCDGMTISYGNPNAPGTVNVPVNITPSVTIGPPVVK